MLAHSFNRIYVVTKFILPTESDKNFSKLKFEGDCEYLRKDRYMIIISDSTVPIDNYNWEEHLAHSSQK